MAEYNFQQKLLWLAHNQAAACAEIAFYNGWEPAFCKKHASSIQHALYAGANKASPFEITKENVMTLDEDIRKVFFGKWDEKLMLIPIWLRLHIPEGEPVTDINGETVPWSLNLDTDARGGYLAYGFKLGD